MNVSTLSGAPPKLQRLAHENYWRHKLAGIGPTPGFVRDYVRTEENPSWERSSILISGTVQKKIQQLSTGRDLSCYLVWLAAIQVLIHKYSETSEITVFSPPYAPLIRGEQHLVPLRSNIVPEDTFRTFLLRIRKMVAEAYAHQKFPVDYPEAISDIVVHSRSIHAKTPLQEGIGIIFELDTNETGGQAVIVYDRQVYRGDCVEALASSLVSLMDQLLCHPDSKISTLSLMSEPEKTRLLDYLAPDRREFPVHQTLAELFNTCAREHGQDIAVVCQKEKRTYHDLEQKSLRLGRLLRRLGVGPNELVGVFVERGIQHLEAVLGILQAGGVYVPMDPSYPDQRIQYMVQDSGIEILITETALGDRLGKQLPGGVKAVFYVDGQNSFEDGTSNKYCWKHAEQETALPLEQPAVASENFAYLLYTSGSTGMPKGALVRHEGAVNHIYAEAEVLGLNQQIRFLQSAPSSSDIAVWQLLGPLVLGGRTVIVKEDVLCDPVLLLQTIREEQITLIELVPGLLQSLLGHIETLPPEKRVLDHLRMAMVTGEAASVGLVNQWFRIFPDIPLVNAYGPTEASDDVSQAILRAPLPGNLRNVPIGKPIANMTLYVLDSNLNLLPIGAPGEICIAGIGVGGGYWKKEDKTRSSFVLNPHQNSQKNKVLYKTGDLGRWLPDGNLEFLGRKDHQVKIRGFRIELGEIENVLLQNQCVAEVVVVVHEKKDVKRLIAYAASKEGQDRSGLDDWLEERLPDHMIPLVIWVERLPRLPSGKVDRNRLPDFEEDQLERAGGEAEPRSETEMLLVRIWSQVLGREKMGIHDNFFAMGGDSILSIQVISRARQAGLHLSPKDIFAHQTIAALAASVQNEKTIAAEQGVLAGSVPLLPVQQWFFEQECIDCHHYNQAVMLRVNGDLESFVVSRCVSDLLIHHDALRMRFEQAEQGWKQTYAPFEENGVFREVDLSSLSVPEWKAAVAREMAATQASLNLQTGPVMKVVWFTAPPGESPNLLLVIHHLVVDGISWRILLEDLQRGCDALKQGQKVSLGPKTSSLREWAEALEKYASKTETEAEIPYWEKIIAENETQIPVDFADGINRVDSGRYITAELTCEETQKLVQELPEKYRAQITDILLTALALAFEEWSKQSGTLVDLEGHGREDLFEHLDVTRTIGWFTSIYPVVLRAGKQSAIADTVKLMKEQMRAVPNKGFGFGLLRFLKSGEKLSFKNRSRPQVTFNYLGQFDQVLEKKGLFSGRAEPVGGMESPARIRGYQLDINGGIAGGKFGIMWEYSVNLHKTETVERLAARFIHYLREIIAQADQARTEVCTPSDFPLVDLNQNQLDEVLAKVEFQ